MNNSSDGSYFFMDLAIHNAHRASLRGEVPVGAIVAFENKVISSASNETIENKDPTAHAEILAIRRACIALNSHILDECDIYVTLEPCAMCAQAISLARIRRLYFGAYDKKYGGVEHGCRVFDHAIHKTEIIGGVFETQCSKILQDFFKKRRY